MIGIKSTSLTILFVLAFFCLVGCSAPKASIEPKSEPLTEARSKFHTTLIAERQTGKPMPTPPADVFQSVYYYSPAGRLGAYLTPPPNDDKKHPAIIWITGGDCNTIDDGCWADSSDENDQTAAVYRKSGIVMMFPSLRGGNNNPGYKEGLLGEVDDVIAAAAYLKKQPFVDPERIYLGGHSTGGTLALLTAECTPRFRAVFAFGPVRSIASYGAAIIPYINLNDTAEVEVRSPGYWLASVKSPTFIIEGTNGGSNIQELYAMKESCTNEMVHFQPVTGADHFSVLAPTNRSIATAILNDTGPTANISF
jgi:acetyl esterase/lipase